MSKEIIATGCLGVFSVACSILFIESTTFYKILFSVVSISGTIAFCYNTVIKILKLDTTTKILKKIDETNERMDETNKRIEETNKELKEEIKTINLTMREEFKAMNSTMLELIKTLKK